MTLPFTRDQFLDVFAEYNEALWPVAIALWVLTAVAFVSLWRSRAEGRAISFLLALHWLWTAVAYHAAFFSAINPAAMLFAALFLIESGLIAWYGLLRQDLSFTFRQGARPGARLLVAYALLYPAIVWSDGFVYPWMPTFGVPCPTTILTIGFLLAADRPIPRPVIAVPMIWSAVSGSAAFVLGVHADLILPVAGIFLAIHALTMAVPKGQPS